MFLERNTIDIPVPGSSESKELACDVGDPGSILGSGRSSGGGTGYPHQYSCLENCINRGAWWATVHGVCKSKESDTTEQLTLFHHMLQLTIDQAFMIQLRIVIIIHILLCEAFFQSCVYSTGKFF